MSYSQCKYVYCCVCLYKIAIKTQLTFNTNTLANLGSCEVVRPIFNTGDSDSILGQEGSGEKMAAHSNILFRNHEQRLSDYYCKVLRVGCDLATKGAISTVYI